MLLAQINAGLDTISDFDVYFCCFLFCFFVVGGRVSVRLRTLKHISNILGYRLLNIY